MNNWHVWVFKIFVLTGLLSCVDSSNDINEYGLNLTECSANTQKEYVHRAMQDKYLWYQDIPALVNYSAFSSPNSVVSALRHTPEDRFSYVTTVAQHDSFYKDGQYVGFGFSYTIKKIGSSEHVIIRFAYKDSPAYRAGMRRGQELISINGQLMSNYIVTSSSGVRYIKDAFGENSIGVNKQFVMKLANSASSISFTLVKDVVTINTVLTANSIRQNGKTYGYLAFKSFINPSYKELNTAFSQFQVDGAEKLILDLRYNGGGSVAVAAALASLIHKPTTTNKDLFTVLKFNNKYQSENSKYFFKRYDQSLSLNEVIILTTSSTCSASEMVINALEPFINVTVVGSTTCGKPVGMRSQTFCGNKLLAINFQGFNNSGFGDYFNGLNPDCAAEDDLTHNLGDVNEGMLKAALDYDNSAVCAAPKGKSSTVYISPTYEGLQREYASE